MNESIDRLAVKAGVGKAVAENALGAIPGCLRKEGPVDRALRFNRGEIGADGATTIFAEAQSLSQFA